MLLFAYISVLLLNLVFFMFRKKSTFLKVVTLVCFWFVLCANENVPDYSNYMYSYGLENQTGIYAIADGGYEFLTGVGTLLGLSYPQFRAVLCFFLLLAIDNLVKKIVANAHYVYFFYGCYLLFPDAIQLRYFIATVFFAYATYFLSKEEKKYRIMGCLCIMAACFVHLSMLLLIPLVVLAHYSEDMRRQRRWFGLIIIFASIIGIYIVRSGNYAWILSIIRGFTDDRRTHYLYTHSNWGFLYPLTIQLYYWILMRRGARKNSQNDAYTMFIRSFVHALFILIPLYMINVNFFRFLRMIAIPFYMAASIEDDTYQWNGLRRFGFNLLVAGNSFLWIFFEAVTGDIGEIILHFFKL